MDELNNTAELHLTDVRKVAIAALRQLRKGLPILLALYLPTLLLIAGSWYVGTHVNRPVRQLEVKLDVGAVFRDAAQTAGLPPYVGFPSNIGTLAFFSAAAVALFVQALMKGRGDDESGRWRSFFLLGGILTAVLAADDLLMIHEEIVPNYLFPKRFHVSESYVFICYGLFAMYFFWHCHPTILNRTDFGFLLVGAGFLGLSVAADKFGLKHIVKDKQMRYLVEDGAKLLGIVGWSHYFWRTALRVMRDTAFSRQATQTT